MSDLNPETAPPTDAASRLSIARDMWLRPRAVLQQEIQHGDQRKPAQWSHWWPAMAAGVAAILDFFMLATAASNTAATHTATSGAPALPAISGQGLILTALLLGPLSGLLHAGIMGFVLRQLGRLFGGNTTPDVMRRGISLALVPMAYSLLPILFELWWREQHGNDILVMISTGVRALLNIWALLLLVMTVSELQRLPLRRAFGTVVCAIALLFMLVLLLQPR